MFEIHGDYIEDLVPLESNSKCVDMLKEHAYGSSIKSIAVHTGLNDGWGGTEQFLKIELENGTGIYSDTCETRVFSVLGDGNKLIGKPITLLESKAISEGLDKPLKHVITIHSGDDKLEITVYQIVESWSYAKSTIGFTVFSDKMKDRLNGW